MGTEIRVELDSEAAREWDYRHWLVEHAVTIGATDELLAALANEPAPMTPELRAVARELHRDAYAGLSEAKAAIQEIRPDKPIKWAAKAGRRNPARVLYTAYRIHSHRDSAARYVLDLPARPPPTKSETNLSEADWARSWAANFDALADELRAIAAAIEAAPDDDHGGALTRAAEIVRGNRGTRPNSNQPKPMAR